jgi:iron(III) transport system ATP-binding protein
VWRWHARWWSNLDAKLRRRVRQEIRELQQSLELTVLYVTHDQEEALAVSDRVIVMHGGRIAQQGTPHALYETPATRFLADFIGDANLIDGHLQVDGAGAHFTAHGAGAPVHAGSVPSGPATLALRPHRLHIVEAGQGVLPGLCRRAAYLGNRVEVVVDTAWGELLVFDAEGSRPRRRDEAVGLAFDPAAAIVIAAGTPALEETAGRPGPP